MATRQRARQLGRCSSIQERQEGFILPKHRDRLWGPTSLLFSRYRGLSPGLRKQGRKSYNSWNYLHSPTRLHGTRLPILAFSLASCYFLSPRSAYSQNTPPLFFLTTRQLHILRKLTFCGKDLCIRAACEYPILAANSHSATCKTK